MLFPSSDPGVRPTREWWVLHLQGHRAFASGLNSRHIAACTIDALPEQ
jgi:hypothetical protein